MRPITLPDPSPGNTIRVPLDPQPPEGWKPLTIGTYHPTIVRKGEQRPGQEIYGASDDEWGCEAPCKPGETYNGAKCLSVDLEHGECWEWVIEFEVTNTRSE